MQRILSLSLGIGIAIGLFAIPGWGFMAIMGAVIVCFAEKEE